MGLVKSTWHVYSKITLKIGILLLVLAFIFLLLWLTLEVQGLEIWSLVLGINGIMWFILGIIFSIFANIERNRLKRLKGEGVCYTVDIKQIKQNIRWIRMGNYLSAFAICSYQNNNKKTFLVKSNSFIIESFGSVSDYSAIIYVNRNDLMDYSIEINNNEKTETNYDHNYE